MQDEAGGALSPPGSVRSFFTFPVCLGQRDSTGRRGGRPTCHQPGRGRAKRNPHGRAPVPKRSGIAQQDIPSPAFNCTFTTSLRVRPTRVLGFQRSPLTRGPEDLASGPPQPQLLTPALGLPATHFAAATFMSHIRALSGPAPVGPCSPVHGLAVPSLSVTGHIQGSDVTVPCWPRCHLLRPSNPRFLPVLVLAPVSPGASHCLPAPCDLVLRLHCPGCLCC